jgi:hypothetical protein
MGVGRVLVNAIALVEFLSFFYVIFRREVRAIYPKRIALIVGMGVIWLLSMLQGFDWQARLVGPINGLLPFFIVFSWVLFAISIKETVLISIFAWLILTSFENITVVAFNTSYYIGNEFMKGIVMLMIIGLLWIFYIVFKNKYRPQAFQLPLRIWILLDSIMLIMAAMFTFFSFILTEELAGSKMNTVGQKILLLGEGSIIILLFAFVYFYSSSNEYRVQKDISELQMKQQKEYYSQLLGREEETRKFRHDIINDLLKIQDYCANEKYQAMSQYIERITGIVISLNKKKYDVGNDVINSVINYYLSPTEKKYSVEVKGFVSDNISIDDRDLCVICGNMIGNAIEAVDRMKEGKIWIEAGAGKEYISLRVKNTYQGKLKFNKEGFPITTKTDKINHGIGTRNIYDVVKKNGGEYLINAKDGIFNAEVILKKSFA